MVTSMEDPYLWMENLSDERVLKFIEEENAHFREFIGDIPDKLIDEVKEYYYLPNIWRAQLTEKGIFVQINEKGRQLIKLFDTGYIIVD